MKAYKHLIKHALAAGCTISVWDGEEWELSRSKTFTPIDNAVRAVEEAELKIYLGDKVIGWALVSAYGLEDDETVIDHTVTPFLESWWDAYELTLA